MRSFINGLLLTVEVLEVPEGDKLRHLPHLISEVFIEKFEESLNILEQLYIKNKKWIVTYSGGKDSTALVVLALYMKEIHPDIDLNITYSDTLMEIPQMSLVANRFLGALERKYTASVRIVKPIIDDTYWVRMIGRGYPPPGPRFRWCTPKIKINPSRRLHNDNGLFITGLRIGESQQRDSRIKNSCLNGSANECGSDVWVTQRGIDVAAPIINWTSVEVWQFLMFPAKKTIPEVQYVIDLYGNTAKRFGCWMCTVVMKDKTMISMAESGDHITHKLLVFREWLVNESKKTENRYIRKDGRKGRLTVAYRKRILEKLFELQSSVHLTLISEEEISAIRTLIESKKYEEY